VGGGVLPPAARVLLPLAGVVMAARSLFQVLATMLRAQGRALPFVVLGLLGTYGGMLAGVGLVLWAGLRVDGVLAGIAGATLLACAGAAAYLGRTGARVRPRAVSGSAAREFAAYGVPAAAAALGGWVLSLSDRWVIEHFRGAAELGVYAVGYMLANEVFKLVVTSMMMAVGPTLVRTWESDDRAQTGVVLRAFTRTAVLLLVPMLAGILVLGRPMFLVVSTDEYLAGAAVLPWVALGASLYGMNTLAYTGLTLAKKSRVTARNVALAGAVNLGLNLAFVPRFGFIAAGVNTAVGYAVLLALNVASSHRYLPWLFPWASLARGAAAAAGMWGFLHLLPLHDHMGLGPLLAAIAAGAAVYGVLLSLLGELPLRRGWAALRRRRGAAGAPAGRDGTAE
jgi:O-antigen/teichoic acid export membrane protein